MSTENKSLLTDFASKLIPKHEDPQICSKIELQKFDVDINNLPDSFKDFKICHISDLHNVDLFGKKPKLLEKISQENPDIIVISGDSINNNKIDNAIKTISLFETIVSPQNIFMVTGNHEFLRDNYEEDSKTENFFEILKKNNVNILQNDFVEIKKNDESLYIMGLEDPLESKDETKYLKDNLDNLVNQIPQGKVKILISHRPEKIDLYSQYNIDLVFTGHAHGGQIIIPFVERGLLAPHQGLFPKYTNGIHVRGTLQEIISPGLSNEFIIPRINNPGKIYFVNLK